MTIPIFQTRVGQKAGLRHELKALLRSSVVLHTKFHLVPLVLTKSNVDNLDDYGEKKRSFGIFGEG